MNNQQIENDNLTNEISDLAPRQTEVIKGGQTREHILLARTNQATRQGRVAGDWNGDGDVDGRDFTIYR